MFAELGMLGGLEWMLILVIVTSFATLLCRDLERRRDPVLKVARIFQGLVLTILAVLIIFAVLSVAVLLEMFTRPNMTFAGNV